jgi:Prim-pol 4/Herpesviridae UL52/UL70 DNA primase
MQISKWNIKGDEAPTHVLMNGGQLYVPDKDLDSFYRAYLTDLVTGKKLYVVEQKTECFKFFVDIDYKAKTCLKDDEVLDLCRNIYESVDRGGKCLVARAPIREEKGLVKTGIHMHWPDLVVDKSTALSLRTQILLNLEDDHWSDTIDPSVYKGAGLRCLWSLKKGVIGSYVPWRSVPDGSLLDPAPCLESLKLFSIRSFGTESGSRTKNIASGNLEEFIQKNLEGQANARVRAVRRTKKGEGKGFYVETDSKWCERVQREHKSNHVWFYINGGNIVQKCMNEECLEFSGREHFLPPSISNESVRMDPPPSRRLVDLLPKTWLGTISGIRKKDPPVFGS